MAVSGLPGLLLRGESRGERLSCLLILTGALCCAWPLVGLLHQPPPPLVFNWSVPAGHLVLALDGLAAVFLAPLLLVAICGSIYALGYWSQKEHPQNGVKLRLFYGLICAAMILLLVARNGLLFLCAWEVMALSAYFLITTEDRKAEVRRAGYIYLIATHTGTLALFGLFALLNGGGDFPLTASIDSDAGSLMFLLGLFGFGMKAGLMPLHIWLPGAHAAAPSHASALLSGVMIKTGIYGLVRLTSFFAQIPPWWGWTLLGLGMLSGIMGVALALAQHDIKRLLAYHSVENIGIIALGLGLALLGRSYNEPTLIVLGFSGCVLHVANHGIFKALLFLGAGSMIHAVGSRELDHYGGLLRRQRWTGLCFLGGAVAICGLPPFNGFVSEWLIYLGIFGAFGSSHPALMMALVTAPALALIGALALACFVKVFGLSFLGEPRTPQAAAAQDVPGTMRWPQALLLLACILIGLLPFSLRPLLELAVTDWAAGQQGLELSAALAPLGAIGAAGWILIGLLLWGGWSLRRRAAPAARNLPTWGCGYPFPAARMQYTASSFADSLVRLFRFGLWTERHGNRVKGLFPSEQGFVSHTADLILDRALTPVFGGLARLFCRLRHLIQHGITAIYLLYVALTLLVLLTLLTR
jgi:hydrogenase-4 component B